MREQPHITSRAEALSSGLPLYGIAREIYWDGSGDPGDASFIYMIGNLKGVATTPISLTEGEVLGTFVGMIKVDSNEIVLGSLIQRGLYRWQRTYERQVRKAVRQEAATIQSWNRAALRTLPLLEAEPDAGPEV